MRENRTCSLGGGRRLARKRASSDPTIQTGLEEISRSDGDLPEADFLGVGYFCRSLYTGRLVVTNPVNFLEARLMVALSPSRN